MELCDLSNLRTKRQICKELDIAESTLYYWFNQDKFLAAYNHYIDVIMNATYAEIIHSLTREARKGNMHAIRLWMERFGNYVPTAKIEFGPGSKLTDDEIKRIADGIAQHSSDTLTDGSK